MGYVLKLWRTALISSCFPATAEYGSLRSMKKSFLPMTSIGSATQMPERKEEEENMKICNHMNNSRTSSVADKRSAYHEFATD